MSRTIVIGLLIANAFSSVHPCPLGCSCIEDKYLAICDNADFDHVPSGLSTDITELSLRKNRLKLLSDTSLPETLALIKLDLSTNEISDISKDAFGGRDSRLQQSLAALNLNSNALSLVPTEAFQNLIFLKDMSLAGNSIKWMRADSFTGLRRLERLDLSRNGMDQLAADAFRGLENVQYLNLSENSLNNLSPGMLRHLTSLSTLDISRNSIRNIYPGSLSHFTRLHELHLSANRLSAIEPGIFTTISYNLKKLDLTRNEITLLKHGLFWGCSTLVTLELGHNMMSYISEEQEFPFQGLLSLRVLRLNSNRLVGLPGDSRAWNDMAKLEELHLSGNLLQVLPEFKPVTRLPGIKFIDLSANLITRLGSETFRGFPSLEKLDASNNAITEISWDALAQNPKISIINLERNRLTTPNISWLVISTEKSNSLSIPVFNLANNPWFCDCRAVAFANSVLKIKSNTKIYTDIEKMTCHKPDDFKGQNLSWVAQSSHINCTKDHDTGWLYILFIIFTTCIIFAFFKIYFCTFSTEANFEKPISKYL